MTSAASHNQNPVRTTDFMEVTALYWQQLFDYLSGRGRKAARRRSRARRLITRAAVQAKYRVAVPHPLPAVKRASVH